MQIACNEAGGDEENIRLSILKWGNLPGRHWKFSLSLKHPVELESALPTFRLVL